MAAKTPVVCLYAQDDFTEEHTQRELYTLVGQNNHKINLVRRKVGKESVIAVFLASALVELINTGKRVSVMKKGVAVILEPELDYEAKLARFTIRVEGVDLVRGFAFEGSIHAAKTMLRKIGYERKPHILRSFSRVS